MSCAHPPRRAICGDKRNDQRGYQKSCEAHRRQAQATDHTPPQLARTVSSAFAQIGDRPLCNHALRVILGVTLDMGLPFFSEAIVCAYAGFRSRETSVLPSRAIKNTSLRFALGSGPIPGEPGHPRYARQWRLDARPVVADVSGAHGLPII